MTDLELDLRAALGAEEEESFQVLALYIPDRDRDGEELGNQRRWVLEGAELLARIGGGVTIEPPAEGGWLDDERGVIVWERPVRMFTYLKTDRFEALVPELRSFLHRLGRETRQGEVAVEFDHRFLRIRSYDEP